MRLDKFAQRLVIEHAPKSRLHVDTAISSYIIKDFDRVEESVKRNMCSKLAEYLEKRKDVISVTTSVDMDANLYHAEFWAFSTEELQKVIDAAYELGKETTQSSTKL